VCSILSCFIYKPLNIEDYASINNSAMLEWCVPLQTVEGLLHRLALLYVIILYITAESCIVKALYK